MWSLMILLIAFGALMFDQGTATPTPPAPKNETNNSTDGDAALSDSELPWWSVDDMFNNVFPWSSNYRPPTADQNDEKYFLRGPDGKDGPMKHIMRVLSILPPTEEQLETYKTFTPPPGAGRAATEVCPLFVDPLYEYGQYRPCSPINVSACPITYSCQLSPVLGAHLCCRDIPQLQTTQGGNFLVTPGAGDRPGGNPWDPFNWLSQTTQGPPGFQPGSGRGSWVQPANHLINPGPYGVIEPRERRPNWAPRQLHPNREMETAEQTDTTTLATTTLGHTSTSTIAVTTTSAITEGPSTTEASTSHSTTHVITSSTPLITTSTAAVAFLNETDILSANTTDLLSPGTTTVQPSTGSHAPKQSTEHLMGTPIPGIPHSGMQVVQLTVGSVKTSPNGDIEYSSTMTLIRDGDKNILVDTGLPTDTNTLIRELAKLGLRPEAIDIVITTHGHPDHYGNQNLFSRKRQLFASYEYIGNKFYKTPLADNQSRKLTTNVEVWKTPGHTPEDLTVVVRNVPNYGTIAIAGDLVLHEEFLSQPDRWASTGSWDVNVQKQNLNLVLCMADWIVPGHGATFKVTEAYRKQANCANANRFIFNGRHKH